MMALFLAVAIYRVRTSVERFQVNSRSGQFNSHYHLSPLFDFDLSTRSPPLPSNACTEENKEKNTATTENLHPSKKGLETYDIVKLGNRIVFTRGENGKIRNTLLRARGSFAREAQNAS